MHINHQACSERERYKDWSGWGWKIYLKKRDTIWTTNTISYCMCRHILTMIMSENVCSTTLGNHNHYKQMLSFQQLITKIVFLPCVLDGDLAMNFFCHNCLIDALQIRDETWLCVCSEQQQTDLSLALYMHTWNPIPAVTHKKHISRDRRNLSNPQLRWAKAHLYKVLQINLNMKKLLIKYEKLLEHEETDNGAWIITSTPKKGCA